MLTQSPQTIDAELHRLDFIAKRLEIIHESDDTKDDIKDDIKNDEWFGCDKSDEDNLPEDIREDRR